MVFTDVDGNNPLSGTAIKALITESDDFFISWFIVCRYIVRMELTDFHISQMRHRLSHKKTLQMAGRGFGKSYLLNTSYCLTHILRNPEITIAVITRIERQSKDFVGQMKRFFEPGSIIHEIFGDLRGDKWDALQFSVKRTENRLENTITACAVGSPSSLVSKHYDILVLDDIVNSKTSANKNMRDGTENTLYNDILPAMNQLSPYKYIHFIGTHFHPDDLYARLEKKGTYRVQKLPAMKKRKGKLHSIWEDKVPTKDLLELQGENPLAFEQQYMQKVQKGVGGIFRSEWIQYFDRYTIKNDKVYVHVVNSEGKTEEKPVKIYMANDLAIAQHNKADFFVCTVTAIDDESNVYILDYNKGRYTFKQQMDVIVEMYNKWSMAIRVGIETNGFQLSIFQELSRKTKLPLVKIKTSKDKISRLNAFGSLFEAGKVFFYSHMPSITDYVDEFLGFPEADHDDVPDSACLSWEVAKSNIQQTSGINRSMLRF